MATNNTTRRATQVLTRMWRHLGLVALAVMLAVGAGFPASAAPAPAESCATMLKPNFDWAGPQPITQATYKQAYGTITDHTTKDIANYELARDEVWYGATNFYKTTVNGQTVLQGDVYLFSNQVDAAAPFQRSGTASYFITVQPNGIVSIQPRVSGKNFLGRGPTVYQGTCSGGLIVATQTNTTLFTPGNHSLTISFHNNNYYYMH
jgi:hypothetical protein